MRTLVIVTALAGLATVSACGTRHLVAVPDRPSASASPAAACPPDAAARPTPCVSDLPERLQRSNHMFQQRVTVPPDLLAAQEPARRKVTAALNRLTAARRRSAASLRAALSASGVPAHEVDLVPATDARDHQFGVLIAGPRQAICVFGTVTPEDVSADLGGITMEGGCVAGPGGH